MLRSGKGRHKLWPPGGVQKKQKDACFKFPALPFGNRRYDNRLVLMKENVASFTHIVPRSPSPSLDLTISTRIRDNFKKLTPFSESLIIGLWHGKFECCYYGI